MVHIAPGWEVHHRRVKCTAQCPHHCRHFIPGKEHPKVLLAGIAERQVDAVDFVSVDEAGLYPPTVGVGLTADSRIGEICLRDLVSHVPVVVRGKKRPSAPRW